MASAFSAASAAEVDDKAGRARGKVSKVGRTAGGKQAKLLRGSAADDEEEEEEKEEGPRRGKPLPLKPGGVGGGMVKRAKGGRGQGNQGEGDDDEVGSSGGGGKGAPPRDVFGRLLPPPEDPRRSGSSGGMIKSKKFSSLDKKAVGPDGKLLNARLKLGVGQGKERGKDRGGPAPTPRNMTRLVGLNPKP